MVVTEKTLTVCAMLILHRVDDVRAVPETYGGYIYLERGEKQTKRQRSA